MKKVNLCHRCKSSPATEEIVYYGDTAKNDRAYRVCQECCEDLELNSIQDTLTYTVNKEFDYPDLADEIEYPPKPPLTGRRSFNEQGGVSK